MCRSVADAAAVLSVIAGFDPLDNYTSTIPNVPNYTKALKKNALKGKRIGVPRNVFLDPKYTGLTQAELDAFEGALKTIKALGATVVDNADLPSAMEILNSNTEFVVLSVDFKVGSDKNPIRAMLIRAPKIELNAYFAGLVSNPSGVRNLADLIKFNDANKNLEEPEGYEDQSRLIPHTACSS
jgi:amidase